MSKDINYIIKRVIVGVLIGIILFTFKSCNAKAYTNNVIGSNVEFPLSGATFLSMNSNTTYSTRGYRYFYGSTLNPTLYMATPTGSSLTCGTYGCGISLDGNSVLQNNYYAITIYLLGDNSPNWHYSYSNVPTKVGVSNGTSSIDSNNWVNIVSGTTGLNKICDSYFDNEYTGNCLFQWTIVFKAPISGTSVQTWWSSSPSGADPMDNGFFVGYTLDYIGDSSLTPEQLNSALNNMTTNITTSINNNISNSTTSIINNDNSNTNRLIGSISDMADDILTGQENSTNAIIDSEKVCNNISYTLDKYTTGVTNGYLESYGVISNYSTYRVSDYIPVVNGNTYNLSMNYTTTNSASYCLYNNSKNMVSCQRYSRGSNFSITPTIDGFIRISFDVVDFNVKTIFSGESCKNGNQAITDSINELNDTMKDDTPASSSDFNDAIDSVNNAMPTNSTIASLVTMPITFLQKIVDGLGGTCTPITIGDIFGFTMEMPCINPGDYIGIIWNIIDVICAGFFAFVFGKKLVVIFHNITSMHEGGLKEAYD